MKEIRRFRQGDETELTPLIHRCFLEINIEDYSLKDLQYWVTHYTPEHVRALAEKADTYVCEEDGVILGTCSILWEDEAEPGGPGAKQTQNHSLSGEEAFSRNAFIEALYVSPDRAREGIASLLLEACEKDPAYKDAGQIWVHSSITARRFYEQKGYLHETGEPVCIENDRYIMYKPVRRTEKLL